MREVLERLHNPTRRAQLNCGWRKTPVNQLQESLNSGTERDKPSLTIACRSVELMPLSRTHDFFLEKAVRLNRPRFSV
jgi:hypothetical protein